jgi:hypothetical protein
MDHKNRVEMKWLSVVLVFFMGIVSCQNKPCREIQAEKMGRNQEVKNPNLTGAAQDGNLGSKSPNPIESEASSKAAQLKVRVYKPDGSLQCGMGHKIPLEEMERELKGISVSSRINQNDGLMRIQVCGAPTGQCNIYEIDRKDLAKALNLGFKEWTLD